MTQTTISLTQPIGFEGQVYTQSLIQTRGALQEIFNAEATAKLPFGRVIVRGATSKSARLPTADADVILGIAIPFDGTPLVTSGLIAGEVPGYAPKQQVNYLTIGEILVWVENAVDVNGAAFYRYAAGAGGSVVGRFRSAAVANEVKAYPNARFLTATTGPGLAVLSVFNYN